MRSIDVKDRIRILAAVALTGLPVEYAGAVQLGLRLGHHSYLRFERMPAFITIRNDTESPLVLGAGDGMSDPKLEMTVARKGGGDVVRINAKPLVSDFRVLPEETRDIMLDVSVWYDVRKMGSYVISAVVRHGGLQYESNSLMIDVVSGIEIGGISRAVPGLPKVLRRYSLRYWSRDRREYLFLSVEQAGDGYNYGVFQLGPIIRVFKPVIEVDRSGNVEVVHQSGRHRFIRSVFRSTMEEVRFIDQTYHLSHDQPLLPGRDGRQKGLGLEQGKRESTREKSSE